MSRASPRPRSGDRSKAGMVGVIGAACEAQPRRKDESLPHHLEQPPLERREQGPELVAAPEHRAALADQRPHALPVAERRALLDLIFGMFGGSAEGPEGGVVAAELDRIILPQAGRDHPAVK